MVWPPTVEVLRVSTSEDEEAADEDEEGAAAEALEVVVPPPLLPMQPQRPKADAAETVARRSAARLFMVSPYLNGGGFMPLTMRRQGRPIGSSRRRISRLRYSRF
jgi:hypothetical protein